jgi:uncharacterized membrane protein YphA (DoxX/SURF4 family)
MQRLSSFTIIFLVLLRLAIGWHFLFEGLHKIHSVSVGETTTNRPFSSAGYFRESTGPLGDVMRGVTGDPDARALSLLVVQPLPAGEEPSRQPPHLRMPPGLAQEWERYLARFEEHYDLNEAQRAEARAKLVQAEDAVVLWLTQEQPDQTTTEQKKSFPSGDILRKVPTAERIRDYRNQLTEVREVLGRRMWLFGRDVEKARLRQARAALDQMRTSLLPDLDRHTQALTRSLNLIVAEPVLAPLERLDGDLVEGDNLLAHLPKGPKALETLVGGLKGLSDATRDLWPIKPEDVGTQAITPLDAAALRQRLSKEAGVLQKQAVEVSRSAEDDRVKKYTAGVEKHAKELSAGALPLPEVGSLRTTVEPNRVIEWIDWLTMVGLTVIGACLLLGFFSRTSCWLAAGFLALTYLAMPSFPWLPVPPQNEGNYLFVNKNVIELLALCVLGTTASGRWFGLDAVSGWIGDRLFGKRS